jgi:hypothetical protein
MTVTAYSQTQGGGSVALPPNAQTVVIQLRLPTTGIFVVWGNVTVDGATSTTGSFNSFATMTTLDGATLLDVSPYGPAASMSVALQSTLDLSQSNVNEIVDIRCQTSAAAVAVYASLIAIPVDALSGPAGPPG